MSGNRIVWGNDVFTLTLSYDASHPVSLEHLGLPGSAPSDPPVSALPTHSSSVNQPLQPQPLVEVIATGSGHLRAADRLVHSVVGSKLRLVSHVFGTDDQGWPTLGLVQADPESGLRVTTHITAPNGVAAMTVLNVLESEGSEPLAIDSVAVAIGLGIAPAAIEHTDLVVSQYDWLAEGRWTRTPLRAAGLPQMALELHHADPKGAVVRTSTGTWSTGSSAPTAFVVDGTTDAAWGWQIETNGAWRWEVGERRDGVYVALSGPTDGDHQWSPVLRAGQTIATVPVTIAWSPEGFEGAAAQLTAYRRQARRAHADNTALPVVFNDYMNTLMGDPTTAALLPLIDAAADAGAEVFVIDAGWYDDGGDWWDSVGEWNPSASRFPGGLEIVVDHIRNRGMMPGLWLEPEVIGVRSAMAERLPASAFLERRGTRVREHDRFHLDMRDPAARAHLDAVVDRMVDRFGIGYFKLDYNINGGPGTDRDTNSVGEGLLAHNRAHLDWLDGVLDRHPALMLENCASGAMRQDSALLSRMQVQSTSDQQDPQLYPPIAAAAPLTMLPEQAANWAYPQPGMSPEESAFTLVTSMLGRFYLSGYLNRMTQPERALVREAVDAHRELRAEIREATPRWPLGLPSWNDPWVALGLTTPDGLLLSVWHRDGASDSIRLPLPEFAGREIHIETVFPSSLPSWATQWDSESGELTLTASAEVSARTLRIS